QHRRRHRPAARLRHPVAVHLVRRLGSRVHHGGGGHPRKRRPPGAVTRADPDGSDEEVFAVITGGGTGGHVYPALALADALVTRGHPRDTIRFVGARRGLEARVVPEAGYAIDLLPGRGLQRRLTAANLRAGWDTLTAFARARRIVRRSRPAVVIGVGGYASLPTLVAARLRHIPAV